MFLLDATSAAAGTASGGKAWLSMLLQLSPFLLIIVLMYFIMIRPQKKKQQEEQKMRNSVRVGDELTTIGGICGRVVNVKDDTLIIETGADRNKMTIKKWAIQTVDTVHEDNDMVDDDDDDDDED
jgi:preprotein translocase subunit YajC